MSVATSEIYKTYKQGHAGAMGKIQVRLPSTGMMATTGITRVIQVR